jgi:hypothetical protein
MAYFAGVRATDDWGTDERPKSFRETILFLNPNGKSPLLPSPRNSVPRRSPTRNSRGGMSAIPSSA